MLTLLEFADLVSKMVVAFYICSTFLSGFWVSVSLKDMWWFAIVGFACISTRANAVAHLFMELAIPLPSFGKCCVLGTISLLDTYIADVILSICSSHFRFLSGVHQRWKF